MKQALLTHDVSARGSSDRLELGGIFESISIRQCLTSKALEKSLEKRQVSGCLGLGKARGLR
jgi:hypothetical protein